MSIPCSETEHRRPGCGRNQMPGEVVETLRNLPAGDLAERPDEATACRMRASAGRVRAVFQGTTIRLHDVTRRNTSCDAREYIAGSLRDMRSPGPAGMRRRRVCSGEHTRSGMCPAPRVVESAWECTTGARSGAPAAGCVRCENQSPRRRSGTKKPGAQAKGNGRRRTRLGGAATATEWRRVRTVLRAVVSSTLTEARAVVWTQVRGVVRRPVTAKPAAGDAERGAAVRTTSAASRTARAKRSRRRRRAEPTPGGFEVKRRSGRGAARSWASPACRAALW